MKLTDTQLERFAQQLLDTFCPDGMRNRGGRYTKIHDAETFKRRAREWVKETLAEVQDENRSD